MTFSKDEVAEEGSGEGGKIIQISSKEKRRKTKAAVKERGNPIITITTTMG